MKKTVSAFLALVLILSLIPVSISAADEELYSMRDLEEDEAYTDMTSSQELIDLIKDFEGFSATPYWDNYQWSVGYGSWCGYGSTKPDICLTVDEAEARLRDDLKRIYESEVNRYCKAIGKQPSQQQFDALVDLTYNVGSTWMTGEAVPTILKKDCTALEVVKGFGAWSRSNDKVSYPHVNRRIREALIYLHGEYYRAHGEQDCKSDIEVVSDDDLPRYKVVIFKATQGQLSNGRSDYAEYYEVGEYYRTFNDATRDGYTLVGWEITKRSNNSVTDGERISAYDIVEENLELTAVWEEGVFEVPPEEPPVEPTEPEPTEPEPTEPEPTEPEPTEPEPTEPEPTEPEPTEPEPTEPEPTEPEPTEPEPTEPEPTEPEPTEPEPTEPEPTEPEPTEPEPTEPEPTEPEPTDPEPDELPFVDVPADSWFYEASKYVYDNEYMLGISDTEFNPAGNMTRGMLVTILYRMHGSTPVTDEERACFEDIQGFYYTDAIAWAYANGIVNGVTDTTFEPNRTITRQETVTIFYRYCVEFQMLDNLTNVDLNSYVDAGSVAPFAWEAFSWAVGVGLVAGSLDGDVLYLNPNGTLNRAQAAVLLMRCVEEILYV